MHRKNSGFTLIEIMIVVGILIILLTLGMPSMLNSRMNANELNAIANCRTISNACQSYYVNSLPHTYPDSLDALISPESDPPYIDSVLASGEKSGYEYTYVLENAESFYVRADPVRQNWTGKRYFFADETGVIRASTEGPAGETDVAVSG